MSTGVHSPQHGPMGEIRYAAIGDSFTEGMGDPRADGEMRGWADLVAQGLADTAGSTVAYANFAVRGRLLAPIVDDQLPAALALDPRPTVLTINGGGNDMLRPSCDVADLVARTEAALVACRRARVRPVLLSGPDPSERLPFGRTIRARGAHLTDLLADLAARQDVAFVDLFGSADLRGPAMWSADRIHLNPRGHRRVAAAVLAAVTERPVAVPEGPGEPEAPVGASRRGPKDDLVFVSSHLLPWLVRRASGRSSGDLRTAKQPTWSLIAPAPRTV